MGRRWHAGSEGFSRKGGAGSGLRCWQDDGGAIFGQTQERQFRRETGGTDGDGRCRERWHRRSRGSRDRVFTHLRAARVMVLEDEPGAQARGERPEGSGKADVPRRCSGTSPHLASWFFFERLPSGDFRGEAGSGDGARD